jgi:hypothetical protein
MTEARLSPASDQALNSPTHVQPGPEAGAPAEYPFHDADFVSWWLGSLFLLPPQLQIESALSVNASVHKAEVREVLNAFVAEMSAGQPGETEGAGPPQGPEGEPVPQTALDAAGWRLRQLWRASPFATAIGVLGLGYGVVKGLLAVAGAFVRIVF